MKPLKGYRIFYLFLLVYAVLGFINLDVLPVAWTDEVLNLDPAVQFHRGGQYQSALWPNPNSDKIFAGYLPLIQWVHTLTLYIFPLEIFWIRLPFLLFSIGSIILFYRLIKGKHFLFWATTVTAVVFLDKTVFELSRSMRVEPLLLFLFLSYLNLREQQNFKFLRHFILGLLWMGHLYVWPLVLAYLLIESRSNKWIDTLKNVLIFTLPSILFFYQLNFSIEPIFEQLFHQINQHRIQQTDLPHSNILNSLWYRFYPHYKEQPFMPLVYLTIISHVVFILSKEIKQRKVTNTMITYAGYLGMVLLIFVLMTPQYRYLPLLLVLGSLYLGPYINDHRLKWLVALLLVNNSLSFAGRHTAALLQQKARSPEPVFDFIRIHAEGNRPLILGESIGFYYAYRGTPRFKNQAEYAIDFYPQHQDWRRHDKVYLLTKIPRKNETALGVYHSAPEDWNLPNWTKRFAKGGTYDGTYIYLLKSNDSAEN